MAIGTLIIIWICSFYITELMLKISLKSIIIQGVKNPPKE